jgi:hypothetical protein
MNQSNDRGQTFDSNHLNRTPSAGPAGPSIGAGSERDPYRPAAGDLRGEDSREEFLPVVLHEPMNPSAPF